VHGLILAGGEGSRLAAGGIAVPKPLVEVAGRPQIVGPLETLATLGCSSLTCAVRADFPEVRRLLDGRRFGPPLTVVPCRTPSSLHTPVEGLRGIARGPPGRGGCRRPWRAQDARLSQGTGGGGAAGGGRRSAAHHRYRSAIGSSDRERVARRARKVNLGPTGRDLPQPVVLAAAARRERH